MPSRQQVRELLDQGLDYRSIGERLGIPAGQAHLIATGVPADGGDTLPTGDRQRSGAQPAGQALANPPAENPTSKERVRRWIRSRVRADPQLREATARREEKSERFREPDEGGATVVLTREHNRIAAMIKELKTLPGHSTGGSAEQIAQRGELVGSITAMLNRHETIENEHFWPAVRRALPDGDRWADGAAQRQQQEQETLSALGEHAADSEEFDQLVGRLISQSHQHAAYQDHLFLELRRVMSAEELESLGEVLRQVTNQDSSR
ncbi:hemerythrin domain-containing protein [Haloactinomyces albus]|uniref:Hemerythrin-like domain-containing protein n=1 Tax=Haloactinomyces albus TaxID=1352928 RepID=A0AAE3ZBN6_9ACTN|nr:hemerythrin domain-containing protein [Haloactinomyces albus]MDR7300277.1 hypothetical protein [Haloactinomyces albus]